VTDPARIVVEEVCRDDLEIVIGRMREGAFAVTIAERQDTRHIDRRILACLDAFHVNTHRTCDRYAEAGGAQRYAGDLRACNQRLGRRTPRVDARTPTNPRR
jgi:hypothetical protein